MRLAAGTLLGLLLIVAPAGADTVVHRTPAIGPVMAGDRVVWGEEGRAGGLRLVDGAPRQAARELYRLRPPTGPRSHRSFFHTPWSLSASATRVAAIVFTNTRDRPRNTDVSSSSYVSAAVGGVAGAPLQTLSGSTPERAGSAGCDGGFRSPDAVAVDGDRIAVSELTGSCIGGRVVESSYVIRVLYPSGERTVPVGTVSEVVQLRLAGPFAAWVEPGRGSSLVVFDLVRGVEVARVVRRWIDDFDLDSDGNVALTYSNGRLGMLAVGTPGLRLLDRDVAARGVAVAGGRVLYERQGRRDVHSRLLLRSLTGRGVRRLARFVPSRRRIGDLDLSATHATWAARRMARGYDPPPRGPARIVLRAL